MTDLGDLTPGSPVGDYTVVSQDVDEKGGFIEVKKLPEEKEDELLKDN